jgi:transposase
MALRRRQFTKDFKLQVLREVEAGKPLAQAAREHEVHVTTILGWRKRHEQYADHAFQGNGNAYTSEAEIAELERMVGQQAMEIALLKKALVRLEVRPPRAGENGSGR